MTSPPIESSSLGTSSSMKRPFPLLSAMVLVLQRTYSSSITILLTLCSLLLDRCTSFCLQEHHPAPLMSPAPLPVPPRLCLGRPCLLMMLMIHRRPRSTFHQRCGRRGHPLGPALPRHTRPWRCPTRLERPPRSTSRLPCMQAQDPRPGSHLFDRIGPSRTTTRIDPDRWLLLYQPPRHGLLWLLLHRPPRYPRAPLLSLQ